MMPNQPLPGEPHAIVVPELTIVAQPVQGPDGKAWVAFVMSYGFATTNLVLHPDTAEGVAEAVPRLLTEALAQARRANLGLILPGNGHGGLPPNLGGG